jgi:Fic family protein
MQPSDFTPNAPGRLLRNPRGYWAFIPNPLPPTLDVDWELVNSISSADRALSELAGIARTLPNPHLLIGPFIRREAVLSSRIEGTQASFSDLLFFEASGIVDPRTPDVREVANYVQALEYGLARMNELPLSLRLIREIHERLMAGVRGEHLTPGEFRRSQNWIGPPGCTLDNAVFVPPPEDEMKTALADLEVYWHTPSTLPPLVRLALIHYQFEAIHPFLDGNGRIGRLLMTLLLCVEGLLKEPLLYLSAYFDRYREHYYRHLLAVSHRNAWRDWLDFFLRGVADQARDAVQRSGQLLDLREDYRRRLPAISSSALLPRLMDELFAYPAITIAQVAERLGITPRAAGLNVEKLVKAGLLREITGQQRNRVFIAPDIVQIVEAPWSAAENTDRPIPSSLAGSQP